MTTLPATIDEDLIESIRIGLIKQMGADRLLGKTSEPTVMAVLLNAALHGKCVVSAISRNVTPNIDLRGTEFHQVTVRLEYKQPCPF